MAQMRSTAIAVAVLVTTAIAVPAVAGVASAQAQSQQIDDCRTITDSGMYELNASIGVNGSANGTNGTTASDAAANGSVADDGANDTDLPTETGLVEDGVNASACLVVEASDVTVDGNGHTLDGSNASALNLSGESANASGDAAASADNETLANGIVVRPGADSDTVSNVTVTNVTVQHWYVGVYVQDASSVTLDNVTFADNTVPGFRLANSTDVTIRNVTQTAAQAD